MLHAITHRESASATPIRPTQPARHPPALRLRTDMTSTVPRTCHLCEATCGLLLTVDGPRVTAVRGDPADPFSQGYLCPKAVALIDLHDDPDWLRTPMRRTSSGGFEPIDWERMFVRRV
jgi:anaerobic selenocysteine-containing dehydrogenase